MAGLFPYATYSTPKNDVNFNGGLNTTHGPLNIKDTESPDLLNIDMNKFGSILKRNGYLNVNATPTTGGLASDGLMWYEYLSSGSYASKLLNATNGKMYYMSGMNGTYVDITGSATITAGNYFTSTNWSNDIFMTNGKDAPLFYTGTGNVAKIPSLIANAYTFTV